MNKYDQRMAELTDKFSHLPTLHERLTLSEGDLSAVERELGYSLPADYREFLRDYGESFVATGFAFFNPDSSSFELGSLNTFWGIMPGNQYDLLWHYRMSRDILPLGMLAIGASDQGSVVLALMGTHKGAVYFFNDGQGATGLFAEDAYLVANSFDEFMRLLEPRAEE